MRNNPPPLWAVAAVTDNDEQLRAAVPASMLPINLMDELGCGGVGCAWRTPKPGVVFKLTTERYEFDFAKAVMNMRRPPLGVVRFYDAIELDVAAETDGGTWDTFALWREWVGRTGRHALSARQMYRFDPLSGAYHDAIGQFLSYEWPTTAQIRVAARRLSRPQVKADAEVGYVASYDGAQLYVVMHWIEDMVMATDLRSVGQAMRYFRTRRMLLDDVHEDNVGLARRSSRDVYVIFDANMLDYR